MRRVYTAHGGGRASRTGPHLEDVLTARSPRRQDLGSTAAGFLIALVVLALVAVGVFFVLGGSADIDADVNPPAVDVSSSPAPSASAS